MPALQVKECPVHVYERLRECAEKENRSIAQQTLTIIEEYLGLRPGAQAAAASTESLIAGDDCKARCRYAEQGNDGVDYLARFQATLSRIEQLPPIPVSKKSPSASEILAEIRAEEAR